MTILYFSWFNNWIEFYKLKFQFSKSNFNYYTVNFEITHLHIYVFHVIDFKIHFDQYFDFLVITFLKARYKIHIF